MKYCAICFDAFGTLVEITDKRNPYGKLFRKLGCNAAAAKRLAMTTNTDVREVLAALDIEPPSGDVLEEFCDGLRAEVESVKLLPGCDGVLRQLRSDGYKLWVISNLAPPYGAPLLKIVEDMVDGYTLSYLHGVVKPDPEIYAKACEGLSLAPHEVLMVGDHAENDVAGARAIGMDSVLVPDGGITMAWLKNRLL